VHGTLEQLKGMIEVMKQELDALLRAYEIASRRLGGVEKGCSDWHHVATELLSVGPLSTGELRRALVTRGCTPTYDAVAQWLRRGERRSVFTREGTRFQLVSSTEGEPLRATG
jgi:hypothetical protein